ncbi:hypothetical protein HMPREF9374_1907 [Desmospora sp. 8437]|nr:hypothetical protein HMPREF9374_1907 [Desmospora sp. 8437]
MPYGYEWRFSQRFYGYDGFFTMLLGVCSRCTAIGVGVFENPGQYVC